MLGVEVGITVGGEDSTIVGTNYGRMLGSEVGANVRTLLLYNAASEHFCPPWTGSAFTLASVASIFTEQASTIVDSVIIKPKLESSNGYEGILKRENFSPRRTQFKPLMTSLVMPKFKIW